MKAFQLIPSVVEYKTFLDFAEEAALGQNDLILTNEYIYQPARPCFRKSMARVSRLT